MALGVHFRFSYKDIEGNKGARRILLLKIQTSTLKCLKILVLKELWSFYTDSACDQNS